MMARGARAKMARIATMTTDEVSAMDGRFSAAGVLHRHQIGAFPDFLFWQRHVIRIIANQTGARRLRLR